MNSPAWQAIVPELVPRAQLPDAVSLNSAGFNLARALGPALGGLAVAAFAHASHRRRLGLSAQRAFLCGRDSRFLSMAPHAALQERTARRTHLRLHARRSSLPSLRPDAAGRAVLRTFIFTLFVSAVWALLAVVAARDLHQGAHGLRHSERQHGSGSGRRRHQSAARPRACSQPT